MIRPKNLSEQFVGAATYSIPYANYGNYFITSSYDENNENILAVFKMDADGVLTNVTSVAVDQAYQYFSFFTNGKWFGCGFNQGIVMFKLDANDRAVGKRVVPFDSPGPGPLWMLSDDTIVAYIQSSAPGFYIYKYESGADDWTQIQFIPFVMPGSTLRAAVTDTDILAIDNSAKLHRYSRAANGTLVELVDKFTNIDPKYLPDYSLFWGGGDVFVVVSTAKSDSDPYRGLYIVCSLRNDSTIINVIFFYQSHLGFVGDISLDSVRVNFIGKDDIVVGAPLHTRLDNKRNVQEEPNYGKVAWLRRENSTNSDTVIWVHMADVDSKVGNYFGSAVMSIGNHVGITQCGATNTQGRPICQFWVVPKCITRPIDVTCDTKEFDSCDIDLTADHFTVADSLCENTVTLTDMVYNDYTFTASYTLQRQFVESESCNATLMCPRPVVPQATVPVAAPKGGVTSSGSDLKQWIGASLATSAVIVCLF